MSASDTKTAKSVMKQQGFDPSLGEIQELVGQHVWCNVAPAVMNDTSLMFAKCLVLSASPSDKSVKLKQVEMGYGAQQEFTCKSQNCWLYNANVDPTSFSEIGLLPSQTIPCVLDFLKCRYLKENIYSMAEPLLVAINPYKDLGNTTDEWVKKYRDAEDTSKLQAHVFLIARNALDNLYSVHKNQCIVVSGESGAGKTEATKQIMRYFGAAKSGLSDTRIQNAVLAANPVLEAFGNAKTIRNNNSSRFGRFMQLQVGATGGIEFGRVRNFLLEKSRVLTQDSGERSYHIFYQLIKGATPELRQKLSLLDCNSYTFINSECTDLPNVDDRKDFQEVTASLGSMGLTPEEIHDIYSIVSGTLLLGNVQIIGEEALGIEDASVINPEHRDTFATACNLMFLDPVAIERELTIKTTFAGGQKISSPWRSCEGQMLKESLSKAMYDKLFDWIIRRLNEQIQPPTDFDVFIGLLDIFGFEVFQNNSLEQLFINITNERLQKNFIDIVFEKETRLYKDEGISSANLVWTTNEPVIELLCAKVNSILSLLEDQCLAPGGTDKKLLQNCLQTLKGNKVFKPAMISADTNFIIKHTIGEIEYCSDQFLFKNKDVLRAEMVEVVQASKNSVCVGLFEGIEVVRGKLAKGQLIGSQFTMQLDMLMSIINMTEAHFIRCVKPNEEKKAFGWVASKVLVQLHSLSVLEAMQLRNLGFSYRRPFDEFLYQFKYVDLGISEDKSLSDLEKCRRMLKRKGLPQQDWQIGKTMVFMKQEGTKMMAKLQREVLSRWLPLVRVIECMYLKLINKRKLVKDVPAFIRLQAHIRKQLVVRSLVSDPFGSMTVEDMAMRSGNKHRSRV